MFQSLCFSPCFLVTVFSLPVFSNHCELHGAIFKVEAGSILPQLQWFLHPMFCASQVTIFLSTVSLKITFAEVSMSIVSETSAHSFEHICFIPRRQPGQISTKQKTELLCPYPQQTLSVSQSKMEVLHLTILICTTEGIVLDTQTLSKLAFHNSPKYWHTYLKTMLFKSVTEYFTYTPLFGLKPMRMIFQQEMKKTNLLFHLDGGNLIQENISIVFVNR